MKNTPAKKRILVRGAGDFASAIIHRLHRAGFAVAATELEKPLAVRRGVALSEAVYEGTYTVEGVTARRCGRDDINRVLSGGDVPLVIDPEGDILARGWDAVVDARSAKRNLGTSITDAPVVIAIGPGFEAGIDCHAVVETLPRAGMGRVIYEGSAAPDTGKPYPLDAYAACACSWNAEEAACTCSWKPEEIDRLVFRAPCAGFLEVVKDIGAEVRDGETIARVLADGGGTRTVAAEADGIIRGMIRGGTPVERGMKLGDIDPTKSPERCTMISEKARAIAGGVLEACMALLHQEETTRR
jgi:xanthine dehydrogenase accessory factor